MSPRSWAFITLGALAVVGVYAFVARPVLSDAVPKWLGWEHGALTLLCITLLSTFLTRDGSGRGTVALAPGRRHAQAREPRVDPAFEDAARAYGAFVRDGRDRARVVERLTRTLVALGAREEDARRVVDARLPDERAVMRPLKARAKRQRAVDAVLALANDVSRNPGRARDLTLIDDEPDDDDDDNDGGS